MSQADPFDPASSDPAGEVRAFYESHPYPPPLESLDRHRELYRDPNRRRALALIADPTGNARPDREILVAGCGTSQAAIIAMREPDAHVTGIDVSAASLAHTQTLQRKYGLANLDLRRLAIEEAGALGGTFDSIVCTGVLHHLPDPDAGLRALSDVLAPEGALNVLVYGAYGRVGIAMMQQYCRLLGVRATEPEMHDLAATVGALADDHPISAITRRAADFRRADALADALLNPLERAYAVPEIYAWLERCGLVFARWVEQAPYLPQCGAVASLPHAPRLRALAPKAQHAAVELLRGTMTRHSFIACRSDRESPSQPIAFAGEAWRAYVPLRLPWTLAVRERLPAGASAVLINRAHGFPDLALPIDAAEARILALIDGERTAGEIGASAGAGPEHARRFIERLWEYDQIAIDARMEPR